MKKQLCHCGEILIIEFDDSIEGMKDVAQDNLRDYIKFCKKEPPLNYDTKHA